MTEHSHAYGGSPRECLGHHLGRGPHSNITFATSRRHPERPLSGNYLGDFQMTPEGPCLDTTFETSRRHPDDFISTLPLKLPGATRSRDGKIPESICDRPRSAVAQRFWNILNQG
eukprot:414107-Karenia_brevis.AAC.2